MLADTTKGTSERKYKYGDQLPGRHREIHVNTRDPSRVACSPVFHGSFIIDTTPNAQAALAWPREAGETLL